MKNIGKYLLEKDAHAIISAFVFALLPIFYLPTGFLAAIIVGLVTIHKGEKSGFWVLAWVALPAVATLVLRDIGVFDVLLLRCVIVWAFASLLRRFHSWGLVLEAMALAGVIVIFALHAIFPELNHWWMAKLTAYITETSKVSSWKLTLTPAEYAQRIAPFASGLVALFFLSGVVLELVIAHFWQSLIAGTKNFADMFLKIRIGYFTAGIAVVILVLTLLKVSFVRDAFPIVLLPFFITGLSLMHCLARSKKSLIGVLIIAYAGLIFIPLYIVPGLAAIGFLDTWVNFRKKLMLIDNG